MTLDTYGHLFEDRLDEVAAAMGAARAAERAKRPSAAESVAQGVPAVAQLLPNGSEPRNAEDPPTRASAGQRAFRFGTPDRIRTGATALRGRRARPLHNGGLHSDLLAQPAELYLGALRRTNRDRRRPRSRWGTRTRT
jgi:hypothetical protein